MAGAGLVAGCALDFLGAPPLPSAGMRGPLSAPALSLGRGEDSVSWQVESAVSSVPDRDAAPNHGGTPPDPPIL